MRRDTIVIALCLLGLVLSVPALAEVRIVADRDGDYLMTRVLLGRDGQVWSPLKDTNPIRALNLTGDRNGDLWPTIIESNQQPYYPWVVWSRYAGTDFDLAWSRWTGLNWESVRWLAQEQEDVDDGDDLDVDLSFGDAGRLHAVWWRNEKGVGRVYLSVYLESQWMQPYAISQMGEDSRYPTIEVQEINKMKVWFQTAEGLMEQTIIFNDSVAITDDINPLDYVHNEGVPVKIKY